MVRSLLHSVLSIFLLFPFCLKAQDVHFSQFYHQPLLSNPAQTGIFKGDLRAAGIYRSQWTSVPVNYSTFGIAADMKALQRGNFLVSGGLMLINDKAGDAGMRWSQTGLTGSVAHALGARQAISAGFGISFVQRRFDIAALKFKNQWTGEVFDANLPTKENLAAASALSPSLSAGINWHFEPGGDNRNLMDIGIGASHINGPMVNFKDAETFKLPMRLSIFADAVVQAGSMTDLVGFAQIQQMGKNNEIVAGAGARLWLSRATGKQTALRVSLATRLKDALIPAVQLEYNSWTAGLSYDINTSDFNVATNRRGGFDLALVYRLVKAPPVKTFKSCPIFEP